MRLLTSTILSRSRTKRFQNDLSRNVRSAEAMFRQPIPPPGVIPDGMRSANTDGLAFDEAFGEVFNWAEAAGSVYASAFEEGVLLRCVKRW
jgi:hypothetical protein